MIYDIFSYALTGKSRANEFTITYGGCGIIRVIHEFESKTATKTDFKEGFLKLALKRHRC
jgi:hypothetical protein